MLNNIENYLPDLTTKKAAHWYGQPFVKLFVLLSGILLFDHTNHSFGIVSCNTNNVHTSFHI